MKNQALFSSKGRSKKLKCRLLQFLFGALRVKYLHHRSKPFQACHYFSVETKEKILYSSRNRA